MKYRKEIDGLRAVAVVPVILFHAGFLYFKGGFIGVDIFFVISGYLITNIVSMEIENDRFSLTNFYERRARRIMPMLFFILLLTTIYAWFILLPSDMKSYSSSLISVVFFYSNIHFYIESGYWEVSSELKPLLHTWSLAIEEQYYLFFPLFLFYTVRLKKIIPIILVLAITIVSLCLSQWSSSQAPTSNFYLLPTRFWELAIGALVAMVSVKYGEIYAKITGNRFVNEIMSFTGLIMIVCSILFFSDATPFPSFIALVPTIGAAIIIVFTSDKTIVGKLLGLSPIVQIGLISYSAYLWHQPIIAFAKYQSFPGLSEEMRIILVLSVFPVSYLSWKYIESPFRNKTFFTQKRVFIFWAAGSLIFATIGLLGVRNNGFEHRNLVSSQKILHYQPDNKLLQVESESPLHILAKKYNQTYETVGSNFDNALWYDTLSAKRKLLVIGNSHGENFYNILTSSDSVKSEFQLARYGYQLRFFSDPKNKLFVSPNYKASDVVVICTRFSEQDFLILDRLIGKLYADGKVVVILKDVFLFNKFGSRTLADFMIQKAMSDGLNMHDPKVISNLVDAINKEYYQEFLHGKKIQLDFDEIKVFKNLTSKYKNLIVLDRMDYMCDYAKQRCYVINNQLEKFIFDDGHNTKEADPFYGKRIDQLNWMKLNVINSQLNSLKTTKK